MTNFTDRVRTIHTRSFDSFVNSAVAKAYFVEYRDYGNSSKIWNREANATTAIEEAHDQIAVLADEMRDFAFDVRALPKWKKFILNRIIF